MKLLSWFCRKPIPKPIQTVEYFFNGHGACKMLGVAYIPNAGDYVFCAVHGCTRWIVAGVRYNVELEPSRDAATVTEVTVVLNPSPY